MRPNGLIPPLCTPLDDTGALDRRSLHDLIDHQLAAGAEGVFVLGSSGEAAYLDDGQRRAVVDVARDAVAGSVPLLVGALDTTPRRVAAAMDHLGAHGVDAFVVTAPFYAAVTDEEVAEHFRAVARESRRPLFAYDIPGNVGRRLERATAFRLLRDGVLHGLKDSSGTLDALRRLIDDLGPDRTVSLMAGVDSLADVALGLGADGLIPGLANARPEYFVEILRAHARGAWDVRAVYQRAVTELVDVFGLGSSYGLGRHAAELGALKTLLVARGVIRTATVSPPLTPYPPAAREVLLDLVDGIDRRLTERLHALDTAGAPTPTGKAAPPCPTSSIA